MHVYMTRGVSCSGKSTIVKQFSPHDVLASDDFRKRYLGSATEQRYNKQVFDYMAECLESRLKMMVSFTVIDSTNLKMKDGRRFRDIIRKYNGLLTIINVEPPTLAVLMERNKKRFMETGFYIPESVFERHLTTYWDALPAYNEMVDRTDWINMVTVNQSGNIIEVRD